MNNLYEKAHLTGPFDECIECPYLCNGCSGPRTNAMSHSDWVRWLKFVMKRFGISQAAVSRDTPLSKSTVDDIFAGRRQDISRNTARIIENYVLGEGTWPCAKKLAEGKDIVYQDRPETLELLKAKTEAIKEKDVQIINLRENYNEVKDSIDKELERVRLEYDDDIREYKALVALLREQITRKDDYIDRLAKKAGI